MSARLRLVLAFAFVSAIAGGAWLARWAFVEREHSLPNLPVHNVPEAWRDFRDAPGHVVHVGRQGIACTKCHDLDHGFTKPAMGVCVGCHEKAGRMQHGLHNKHDDVFAGVADCTSCHNFGPGHEDRIWACLRCHDKPQAELAAVVVHSDQNCGKCHHPHTDPAIEPMACVSCHASAANLHAGKDSANPDNCLSCHQAHGHASLAVERCTQCHENKPHALFAGGHETCTGCHAPHEFARDEVKPCRACHENQHVLAEDVPGAHRACTTCHDPHAVAHASDATCENCHSRVSPSHPETLLVSRAASAVAVTQPQPGSHACLGCHKPHSSVAHASLALACTACHGAIASGDHDAHGGKAACTNCHAPHAFAKPQQALACASCHKEQLTAIAKNPGHALCLGCHKGTPHAAELASGLAPIACSTCHKDVHPRKEHAACTSCHEPHSGAPRPLEASCGKCHARQEHASVPAHRECLTCHTPHEGGKLAAASCVGCHAAKAAQNHGAIEGGCTQCHGIHSDKGVRATPECTSCHKLDALPGLHAIEQHHECTKCHGDAHNTGPWSARATCVACHKPQEAHVPEAQTCQGCHVFRK